MLRICDPPEGDGAAALRARESARALFVLFDLWSHLPTLVTEGYLTLVDLPDLPRRRVAKAISAVLECEERETMVRIDKDAHDMLDDAWRRFGFVGMCHLFEVLRLAEESTVTHADRLVWVAGPKLWIPKSSQETVALPLLFEPDPLVTLNVIARRRGEMLMSDTPLRKDSFPANSRVLTQDPRFVSRMLDYLQVKGGACESRTRRSPRNPKGGDE